MNKDANIYFMNQKFESRSVKQQRELGLRGRMAVLMAGFFAVSGVLVAHYDENSYKPLNQDPSTLVRVVPGDTIDSIINKVDPNSAEWQFYAAQADLIKQNGGNTELQVGTVVKVPEFDNKSNN